MTTALHLDGETMIYPIVGFPIGQVKSPANLSAIMAERGFNGLVIPVPVQPEDLDAYLHGLQGVSNVDAVIATVPHKAAMMGHCTRLTKRAKVAGSANIMVRTEDGWAGDNTDGHGFMDGVEAEGFDVRGKPALLVGTGGAGSAIAFEILSRGASELAVHDIDSARRDALIARIEPHFPGRIRAGSDDPQGFALVANATPLGMAPGDPLPVRGDRLTEGQFVGDVVTRPAVPPLIETARARGCGTMTGTGMFTAQAQLLTDILTRARGLDTDT